MCVLCGNENSKIDESYESFSIIDCPNCGKYVISDGFIMDIYEHQYLAKQAIDAIKNSDAELSFLGDAKAYEIYKQRNPNTKSKRVEII